MPELTPSPSPEVEPRSTREYQLLLHVTSVANRGTSVEQLAAVGLDAIAELVKFDLAFFLLIEQSPPHTRIVEPRGLQDDLLHALERLDIPLEFYPQVDNPQFGAYALFNFSDEVKSVLSNGGYPNPILVPLLADHRGLGVLTLANRGAESGRMHQMHFEYKDFLDAVGTQIGVALRRERLMRRLRDSEEQYRSFVMESGDGFWEADKEGRVTLVNQAALDIIGYTRQEVEGKRFSSLVDDPTLRGTLFARLEREGRVVDERVEMRVKNGTLKTINYTAQTLRDVAGKPVRYRIIFRDVTERAVAEAELSRRNNELRVLNEIATLLSNPFSLEEPLKNVCQAVASLTGMEAVALFLVDRSRRHINLVHSLNLDSALVEAFASFPLSARLFQPDFPADAAPGLLEYLVVSKQPLAIGDLDAPLTWDLSLLRQHGFRSGIGTPIFHGDQVYGVLFVGSHYYNSFTPGDAQLLGNIAGRMALALGNKLLFEGMQHQLAELEAIAQVGQLLATSARLENALPKALEEMAKALRADHMSVHVVEDQPTRQLASTMPPATGETEALLASQILKERRTLAIANRESPEVEPAQREPLVELDAAACLAVPLFAHKTPLGVLFTYHRDIHLWTGEEQRLINTFARQLAAALDNSALLRQTQARLHELESVAEISMLTSLLVYESPLIDIALDAIADLLKVELVGVHLLEDHQLKGGKYRGVESGVSTRVELTPILRRVIETRSAFIMDSKQHPPLDAVSEEMVRQNGIQAAAAVPLATAAGALGILVVAQRAERAWTQTEIRIITTIANQLAIAIANARLYQDQTERARRLGLLNQLSQACSASLQLDLLLQTALGQVQSMLNAAAVSVRLVKGDQLTAGISVGVAESGLRAEPVPIDERTRQILDARRPLPINDFETYPGIPEDYLERRRREKVRGLLALPLVAKDRTLGILCVFTYEPHEWTNAEIQFASTIANTISVSLVNASLFESLEDKRRELQSTLDSVFSGVFTTDREGIIRSFNRAASKITGYEAEQMIGRNWAMEIAHVDDGHQPDLLIFEAMEGGEVIFGMSPRSLRTADGRDIPLKEAAAPLLDVDGQIRGAVGAFWDRSEERQSEDAKLFFLTETAHQLRNGLTGMLPVAQLLQKTTVRGATRREAVQVLTEKVKRLEDMSDRFLRLEAERFQDPVEGERLELSDIVERLIEEKRLQHPQVNFQVSAHACCVYADRRRLETVLLNLLENAIRFSPPEKPVSIEYRPIDGGRVRVGIRNEGPGIPTEEQKHLYEWRSRTKEEVASGRSAGHGIGLWLVRTKVREMGGEVCVESDGDQGATFYFTLLSADPDETEK